MSTTTGDQPAAIKDYNDMTPDERKLHDAQILAREKLEQSTLPYRWTQTISDVDITIPVPKGTRARDLNVILKRQHLHAEKGVIVDDDFPKPIVMDDSTWSIEDGNRIHIHLEKQNNVEWWPNVLSKHPKIDTSKIQPENSQLSDLDGDTRAMVEKMMFDQRQKQMGLPTSEEMDKQRKLNEFMKAHPEMDFSNVKVM
ncbi:nuclear movement protein nudC [Ramicandelaber brevisporus]|nr:nuclear movement protein nudC [Ramicandelaber brevisporus]